MSFCFSFRSEKVAVKIIRNIQKYHDAAKVEVEILEDILKSDSSGKQLVNIYN